MRKKFRMVVLTMMSYHEVAFSFDQAFLENVFEECRVRAYQAFKCCHSASVPVCRTAFLAPAA